MRTESNGPAICGNSKNGLIKLSNHPGRKYYSYSISCLAFEACSKNKNHKHVIYKIMPANPYKYLPFELTPAAYDL